LVQFLTIAGMPFPSRRPEHYHSSQYEKLPNNVSAWAEATGAVGCSDAIDNIDASINQPSIPIGEPYDAQSTFPLRMGVSAVGKLHDEVHRQETSYHHHHTVCSLWKRIGHRPDR
jgi:hypothetical protein